MLGMMLERQWLRRQMVPALLKACSFMGNVVGVCEEDTKINRNLQHCV